MDARATFIARELAERGFARVQGIVDPASYLELASRLGRVVGEEMIALRPGAHAYVAMPDRVPLHTDHPGVRLIAWRCEQQDEEDGASLLLDTRPIVASLSERARQVLRQVELECPPLSGGPPTLRHPVLVERPGSSDAIFCSPWLRSADPIPILQDALDDFRRRLSEAAERAHLRVRLEVGEVLLIDNHRVLHGREAISPHSRRRLHRLWMAGASRAARVGGHPGLLA